MTEMSIVEDKNVQTEKTYSKSNKKIQTVVHMDDSDSEDDQVRGYVQGGHCHAWKEAFAAPR